MFASCSTCWSLGLCLFFVYLLVSFVFIHGELYCYLILIESLKISSLCTEPLLLIQSTITYLSRSMKENVICQSSFIVTVLVVAFVLCMILFMLSLSILLTFEACWYFKVFVTFLCSLFNGIFWSEISSWQNFIAFALLEILMGDNSCSKCYLHGEYEVYWY